MIFYQNLKRFLYHRRIIPSATAGRVSRDHDLMIRRVGLSLSLLFLSFQQITPLNIRVLLKEFDTTSNKIFNVESSGHITLKTTQQSQPKKLLLPPRTKIDLFINKDSFFLRTKDGPYRKASITELEIVPTENTVTINGNEYSGRLMLKVNPQIQSLYLINKLDIEDYVYSVLSSECYQTWPHEMQKVQAIVSRTYAMYQISQNRKSVNKTVFPYDIKCNNFHQCYNGTHNHIHLRKAVEETAGLILKYKNNIALTMFDACCGGSIPAKMKNPNFTNSPYLARKTPCNFCKNYSLYSWERKIPTSKFLYYLYTNPMIAPRLSKNKSLVNIKEIERDDAGVTHKVEIVQKNNHRVIISGKELWLSMSDIVRSQNFSISKKGDNVLIKGRGFGHQIGLCQRGACELTKRHWPAKKILDFYYPGTTLAKIRIL